MPLPRYGVTIENRVRFYRDPPDNFGHWYHGHVEVSTPSGTVNEQCLFMRVSPDGRCDERLKN
jgi:hypothetical protein